MDFVLLIAFPYPLYCNFWLLNIFSIKKLVLWEVGMWFINREREVNEINWIRRCGALLNMFFYKDHFSKIFHYHFDQIFYLDMLLVLIRLSRLIVAWGSAFTQTENYETAKFCYGTYKEQRQGYGWKHPDIYIDMKMLFSKYLLHQEISRYSMKHRKMLKFLDISISCILIFKILMQILKIWEISIWIYGELSV